MWDTQRDLQHDFQKVAESWGVNVFLNIFDYVQNAMMIIDTDASILYINDEYTKIFGVQREQILGKNLRQIEPTALALKSLDTRSPIFRKLDYIHSLKINAIGKTIPLYSDSGEFLGVSAIFNDVTKLMKLSNELEKAREMNSYLSQQINDPISQYFEDYICENKSMKKMLALASKAAKTNCSILIQGESGVGKGVLAKAIHNASSRSSHPMITVNCAAIPENLLESELFGYEGGAFTGALKSGKLGKFELADKGTIFLDEIGDMSFSAQTKLLRVLQEHELERVGGVKSIPVDIRVIAATNRNLEDLVKKGTFRQDLFYRISVIPLTIPPLRERREDILPQARYFLKKMSPPGKELILSNMAIMSLIQHSWPGNIRELQNVLEYAKVICSNNMIEFKDLPDYLKSDVAQAPPAENKALNLKSAVELLERDYIIEAIRTSGGNKSKAIELLGISRKAFYDKLERYHIQE